MTVVAPSLREELRTIWRPRQRAEILEWVRTNVHMSERFTNRPGLYDPDFTAYLKPCHQWFGDPDVRTISCPKGAQLGFTTFLANALMWAISEDPGPALFLTSTTDNAQSWAEREWIPRLRDCPRIKELTPRGRDVIKKLEQALDRKSTRLNSSHIPLSRMPSSA